MTRTDRAPKLWRSLRRKPTREGLKVRDLEDLERVRYVAANYGHLQGLRKAPVGLFVWLLAAAGAFGLAWQPEGDAAVVPAAYVYAVALFIVALFVGALALYGRIRVYYERRYGSVRPRPRVPTRRKVLYGTIVLAVLNSAPLFILLLGAAMLFAYWPERRFQAHYVVLGALLVAYGLVFLAGLALALTLAPGLMDVFLGMHFLGRLITLGALGLYFVAGGVLDHLLLVRTMGAAPGEGGDG